MKNRKNSRPAQPQGAEVSNEQIELRAYHLWLASGGGHGNQLQHWLQAEKEIGARANTTIADPENPDS